MVGDGVAWILNTFTSQLNGREWRIRLKRFKFGSEWCEELVKVKDEVKEIFSKRYMETSNIKIRLDIWNSWQLLGRIMSH